MPTRLPLLALSSIAESSFEWEDVNRSQQREMLSTAASSVSCSLPLPAKRKVTAGIKLQPLPAKMTTLKPQKLSGEFDLDSIDEQISTLARQVSLLPRLDSFRAREPQQIGGQ